MDSLRVSLGNLKNMKLPGASPNRGGIPKPNTDVSPRRSGIPKPTKVIEEKAGIPLPTKIPEEQKTPGPTHLKKLKLKIKK